MDLKPDECGTLMHGRLLRMRLWPRLVTQPKANPRSAQAAGRFILWSQGSTSGSRRGRVLASHRSGLPLSQHGVPQRLSNSETENSLHRDLDRLANEGIAPHPGRTVTEDQLAQARDDEAVPGLLRG